MGPISSRGRQTLGWQQDAVGNARAAGASQPGSGVPQTLPALFRVLGSVGKRHNPCRAKTQHTKTQSPDLRRWPPFLERAEG